MDSRSHQINADLAFYTPRAKDAFYSSIVNMYRARAKMLSRVAKCILLATAMIIAAGIWIFWTGDAPDAKITESEAKVRADLIVLNGSLLKARSKIGKAEQEKTLCESAKRLSSRLNAVSDSIQGVVLTRAQDQAENANAAILKAKEILEALRAKPLQDVTIDIRSYEPADNGRFSVGALSLVLDASNIAQVNIELLTTAVDSLHKALQTLRSVGVQGMDNKWEEKDVHSLSDIYTNSDELQKVPTIHSEVERRFAVASSDLQFIKENATKDGKALEEQEAKRDDLQDRLEDLKLQRNKILLMSWLPSLTLRIGVVVLLLFLTQILLSTFRYLAALSGFYYGRADAVQMLQTKADDSYSIIDLKELASFTTPGELKIEPVNDPTEQFTGVLKAWLSGAGVK